MLKVSDEQVKKQNTKQGICSCISADLSDPQKLELMSHARKPEVDISSILLHIKPWLKLLLRLFMTA